MNNLPIRRPNRLVGYDYSKNGAYFITICVKDRHEILGKIVGAGDQAGARVQLSENGVVVEKYLARIWGVNKYVVMPNHLHMIIAIDSTEDRAVQVMHSAQTVPQLIKSFKTLVSKELGYSMFQRSYHDHIIRNEQEYLKIWNYIDQNPLGWEKDCFYVT